MKKNFIKTVLFTVVSSILLTSYASASSSLWSTYSMSRTIGEGTVYTNISGQNSSGLQKVNYIEYTPNSTVTPMIAYGANLYGKSTIKYVQNYLQNQGMDVIGGINGDFFDLTSGIPVGVVINNGVLITSSLSQYAVGFMENGSAIIGKPSINMAIQGPDGKFYTIDYYNKTRNNIGLFLLDSNFASETKISTSGTNITLQRTDDTPVTVGGKITLTVVGTQKTSSSTKIASNQMVLTISDKGPTARFPSYNVGDTVNISITPASSEWAKVKYAVSGRSLISNGTISTSTVDIASSLSPRTAVGIKDNGNLVFYEIDGRQSSYSVGITADQLANEMQNLGCNNVLCLDGGGSSAMIVQNPGDSEAELVNNPSDGSMRSCANYIMLVNKAASDSIPAVLNIYPTYQYILPGASTTLSAKATDSGYHPATLPSDTYYYSDDGMGTVNGNVYTAGSSTGIATVKAASSTAEGQQKIFITSVIDSISLMNNGSAITGLTLNGGDTANLDAAVKYRSQTVASVDTTLNWSVSGNIGTITSDGIFTAANSPGSGTITVSYEGVSAKIPVTIGVGKPQNYTTITNFESEQPFTATNGSTVATTSSVSEVYNGKKSLSVNLSQADETLSITPKTVDNYSVLTCWANSNASNLSLKAIFQDANGNELEAAPENTYTTSTQYTSLSYKIPDDAVYFTGFQISAESGNTIYLDQLLLNESTIINQLPPKLTVTSAPTTAVAGKTVTIKTMIKSYFNTTTINSKDIAATVDGKTVTGSYNSKTGAYFVTTPTLTNGIHRVTIKANDICGMGLRKSFDITVGSSNAKFADTKGNWASYYINFVAGKNIIIGQTQNSVSYFNPKSNLTRSEFAVIMARYLGLNTTQNIDLPFSDIENIPSWALNSVKAVYQAGIMNGALKDGKSYFNPTANITRSEVMTVISKSLPRGFTINSTNFKDQSSIPSWASSHIQYMVSLGLISGYSDGSIKPLANITREEISKIMYNLY